MLIGGGIIGIVSSIITKKEPWATIGILGGTLATAVGLINATGLIGKLANRA
jgi:hypothetical protein